MDVELPAETGLLCRWMAGTIPNWFHFDDALAASEGRLSAPDLWNFLQEGVEAGFLQRRWGRVGQHGAC